MPDGPAHKDDAPSTSVDAYTGLARELSGPVCQGRSGFGALRHFDQLLRNSIRLAVSSGLFASARSEGAWPWFAAMDPEFLHFGFRHGMALNHRVFFEQVLGAPSSYDPRSFWALFWALAKAEHEFLSRYTPFWSHEERLTGHLVSQMMERIEEFGGHWRSLSPAATEPAHCRIWYADTATARREKITGADLGLVVHAKLPRAPEYFKVVRFQAKKVGTNGNATIDLDQVEALTQTENLGYYLFYHRLDGKRWSPAPTVRTASDFAHDLDTARKKECAKEPRGTVSKDVRDGGWDFATFVTFGLADPAAEHGVLADDPCDAARIVMSADGPTPSRLLILTLGDHATTVDWNHIFGEHLGLQRSND